MFIQKPPQTEPCPDSPSLPLHRRSPAHALLPHFIELFPHFNQPLPHFMELLPNSIEVLPHFNPSPSESQDFALSNLREGGGEGAWKGTVEGSWALGVLRLFCHRWAACWVAVMDQVSVSGVAECVQGRAWTICITKQSGRQRGQWGNRLGRGLSALWVCIRR